MILLFLKDLNGHLFWHEVVTARQQNKCVAKWELKQHNYYQVIYIDVCCVFTDKFIAKSLLKTYRKIWEDFYVELKLQQQQHRNDCAVGLRSERLPFADVNSLWKSVEFLPKCSCSVQCSVQCNIAAFVAQLAIMTCTLWQRLLFEYTPVQHKWPIHKLNARISVARECFNPTTKTLHFGYICIKYAICVRC